MVNIFSNELLFKILLVTVILISVAIKFLEDFILSNSSHLRTKKLIRIIIDFVILLRLHLTNNKMNHLCVSILYYDLRDIFALFFKFIMHCVMQKRRLIIKFDRKYTRYDTTFLK